MTPSRWRTSWLAAFTVIAACLTPVVEDPDGGTLGDGGTSRCAQYGGTPDSPVVCASREPGFCGGKLCSVNEACCVSTLLCFPANRPELCPPPQSSMTGMRPCGSSLDCSTDEFCRPLNTRLCGGPGVCNSIANCGSCSSDQPGFCRACGCNGITYGSVQEACVAGVWSRFGACGEVGQLGRNCGLSSQCMSGEVCCSTTGRCYLAAEPWRCEPTIDGGFLDCSSNADCSAGAGGGASGNSWCSGQECGKPGQCSPRVNSAQCPGAVDTVCGCDGRTYINECWARAGGTRVSAQGPCLDAGM
jgi:hypothetical protein